MAGGKHSFIREVKLTNVRNRVNYIRSHAKQENLYATFTNVNGTYWSRLAEQNQEDFTRSGTKGTCIEARELIIMLPPSLIQYDHDQLLQYITATFLQKYQVGVSAALHHNKAKTNLHIHLIFSERQQLEEIERKTATRNMFYDENGKHVRTKKEILDKNGEVRNGCRIIKKGEVYETRYFHPKNPAFKSTSFMEEMKTHFTEVMNDLAEDDERLTVFDKKGPYLPTKKIGKNNPRKHDIQTDNHMRKEWNETVDRALAAGASEEEVQEIKKNFIDKPVAVSIKENGKQPDLFRRILLGAIEQFLKLLHKMHDLTTMIPDIDSVIDKAEEDKASKAADLLAAEIELKYLQGIIDSIGKKEKRIYAIEKSVEDLEKHLEEIRNKWFHGKEKKELENQIYGKKLQMNKLKTELAEYPKMYGFKSVYEVKMAYKKAKAKVNKLKSEQTEGVQKPAKIPEKKNIHTRLGEKKKQVTKQQKSSVKKKQLEL